MISYFEVERQLVDAASGDRSELEAATDSLLRLLVPWNNNLGLGSSDGVFYEHLEAQKFEIRALGLVVFVGDQRVEPLHLWFNWRAEGICQALLRIGHKGPERAIYGTQEHDRIRKDIQARGFEFEPDWRVAFERTDEGWRSAAT